ncbi:MAG: NAD(P)-dependent oxidoreductase [Nitrospina sp.]|nr:NAD(P)-dependent oxidoreductase [Nitrospina sp.]
MNSKDKIYVAGCGGMLGEAFYKVFENSYHLKCTDISINEKWISSLDFRDYDEYRRDVKEFKPNYLVHLGAHTDLEYCETNQEDTYITNTLAVENAVYITNELKIPIIYISTAGIFDGKKDTYDDWDTPHPLGHYARSKYAGEIFVEKNSHCHLVCRAGWMMGGGPLKDKKFIHKIMSQLKNGKRELFIVNDKLGTPTYTHDFAKNVKLLLENEFWGLYNMVCSGITGRYEVTHELIKILGKENEVKITPVQSDYWKKEYFAERPSSERLINKKLDLRKLNIMRDWRVCLKEYINSYYQGYLD